MGFPNFEMFKPLNESLLSQNLRRPSSGQIQAGSSRGQIIPHVLLWVSRYQPLLQRYHPQPLCTHQAERVL